DERRKAQVAAVQIKQVEGVEVELLMLAHGVLQGLKTGAAALIESHHLAVEPGRLGRQGLQRLFYLREARRPVVALAREQPGLAALQAADQPVAVELDLVQPSLSRGRAGYQGA